MRELLAVKIDITLVNLIIPKYEKKIYFYQKEEKKSNPIVEQFSHPLVEH